jgi:hypothetical protein
MKTTLFAFFPLVFLFSFFNSNLNDISKMPINQVDASDTLLPPAIISPINGSYMDGKNVAFMWTKTGQKHVYEIMISTSPDFINAKSFGVKDTSYSFPANELTKNANYYWKVRAFASKKIFSEWSPVYQFYYGIMPVQVRSGCDHNCGSCTHPCGRRPPPVYDIKAE